MNRISPIRRMGVAALALFAAAMFSPVQAKETEAAGREKLPAELQQALEAPMRGAIRKASAADDKRATMSKRFRRVDENTFIGSYHLNTAGDASQTTERVAVTLKKEGSDWVVAEETVKDSFVGLLRPQGGSCYPFTSLDYDEHGLSISAGSGGVCEYYVDGEVYQALIFADGLRYEYNAPDYLYYSTLQPLLLKNRSDEFIFEPKWIDLDCSADQCEELLSDKYFSGMNRPAADARPKTIEIPSSGIPQSLIAEANKRKKERADDRKENEFAGFRPPYDEGRKFFDLGLYKDDNHHVGLNYDSMGGYELQFYVSQDTTDVTAVNGSVFGYYTPETLANSTPTEIEERPDYQSSFYELWKVDGVVEAGLTDPEMFRGDIHYGVTVKQTTRYLPFFIASIRNDDGSAGNRPTMFINSVQMNGEELTWVQVNAFQGAIVFPEEVEAGARVELEMDFGAKAIRKVNHAFSQMNRGGWLPFVRFGDFIDEFALTIKTPSQYKTLGIGHKVWEKKEGGVLTTHWVADSPVVFPTIIYGKYEEAQSSIVAKKPDGTVIPVTVHVDEVSTIQTESRGRTGNSTSAARGIRVKQLKPIAEQAAAAINIYQELSGVPYPYGELNLVNDPAPALYGQAPSSLIYLGSLVFRGEGTMAGGGGGTGTAKFLKSVTAHEVAHQWWGSAIANKNQRNYWFVETMAEYFSAIYLEDVYGTKEYLEQVEEWKRNIQRTDQWVSVQAADTLWQGSNRGSARQSAIYNKGPYAFHIMRMTFGDEKFFPALKQFTQELAAKGEIVSRDIQIAAEKAFAVTNPDGTKTPVDLEWFFDQWIRSPYIPQYKFDYETRRNEAGGWIVEGTITQRMVVGSQEGFDVAATKGNRGVASLTVKAKGGQEFATRVLVEGEVTPFRFAVPEKPLEVVLNQKGEMLSLEPLVNQRSW